MRGPARQRPCACAYLCSFIAHCNDHVIVNVTRGGEVKSQVDGHTEPLTKFSDFRNDLTLALCLTYL